jgi:hypothetical protein
MRISVATFLIVLSPLFMAGQAVTASKVTPQRVPGVETQIIKKVESIRHAAGLLPLKYVPASKVEVQLTCTAALSGKEVYDPRWSGFETYTSDDLSAEAKALKLTALGITTYSDNDSRQIYSDKSWPRYSVVVFEDLNSKPGKIIYRIGISRRFSSLDEFLAPITYDNPVKDSNDWKQQVIPACNGLGSH